jgi:hypothetical protein
MSWRLEWRKRHDRHCIPSPREITTILNQHRITARQLARVVGQIISTGPVTGNLTRILSRHCQMSVACADNWDTTCLIDDYCLQELQFWITNLKLVNARSFKESSSSNRTICSDASATACGAIILGQIMWHTECSHNLNKRQVQHIGNY